MVHSPTMFGWISWFVVFASTLLATILGSDAIRLIAIPVLVVAGLHLLGDWPKRLWLWLPGWAKETAGPAVVVLVAGSLYLPLLAGNLPVNHDHSVFLLQAWVTGTQMIPSGSITGFSPTMFAGFPANSLYPVGTSLLVCFFKGISFGFASWDTAYCWAVFVAVLAYPLALYAVGRRVAGPIAGLAAALLGLIDRGAWFESGWDFNLNWGVWSMGLSFALCLWSLWGLDRLLFKPGRFTLIGTSLAIAGALLCHPMALAILGITVPVFLVLQALFGKLPAVGKWLPRVAGCGLLGGCLTAFWFLPFLARQEWFEPLAYYWRGFEDSVRGLVDGSLLPAFSPALLFVGLMGLLWFSRRGQVFAIFLLLTSGFLLLFSSNSFLLMFDVLKKFPSLSNLQMERFSYFIRSALVLGVGFSLDSILRGAAAASPESIGAQPTIRRHLKRLVLAAVATPFVLFAARSGPYPFFAPAKPMTWASESDLYRDLRTAATYLNGQDRASLGRIAIAAATHEHLLLALPVYTGLPVFKVGFTPEDNYRYKFESRDPAVWKALNVSHALSQGPLAMPELEPVQRFGQLFLYRFRPFDKSRSIMIGSGRAEVLREDPEALDIQLSGTQVGSRVQINLSRYALWRAEVNGIEVPIAGAKVGDSPPLFMELPAFDGLLKLRYEARTPEWIGSIISWLACLTVLLLLFAQWLPRLRLMLKQAFAPFYAKTGYLLTPTLLGLAVLGSIYVGARLVFPVSSPYPDRKIVWDLSDHLNSARGELVRPGRNEPCQPFDGRKIRCPGADWNYAGETILISDHLMRQCIWLHPIEGAKFTLHFDEVELGDFLQGSFALDDSVVDPANAYDVQFSVQLDGQVLGNFTCPSKRGWFSWETATPGRRGTKGRVTVQSEASFTGRRHFCFTGAATQIAE